MSFLGEVVQFVSPFVHLHYVPAPRTPFTEPTAADLRHPGTSSVSVIVSNYRVRLCHIVDKSRPNVDIPLMLIEWLRCQKNQDYVWLDIQTKLTWVFRLVGSVQEVSSSAAVQPVSNLHPCALLTRSPQLPLVRAGSCDVLATGGASVSSGCSEACAESLSPRCLPDPHEAMLARHAEARDAQAHALSTNPTVVAVANAIHMAMPRSVAEVFAFAHFTALQQNCAIALQARATRQDAGRAVVSDPPRGEATADENDEGPPSESLGENSSETSVTAETPRARQWTLKGDSTIPTQLTSDPYTCRRQLFHGPIPHSNDGADAKDRRSLEDGDIHYDTAWGAYNILSEFERMTALPQEKWRLGPRGGEGTSAAVGATGMSHSFCTPPISSPRAAASPGVGADVSPWFKIIPLDNEELFSTYPLEIIVPHQVTKALLEKVAVYRHNGRVPSVSWIHLETGASLSRAAQPGSGSYLSGDADVLYCSYLCQSLGEVPTHVKPSTLSGTSVAAEDSYSVSVSPSDGSVTMNGSEAAAKHTGALLKEHAEAVTALPLLESATPAPSLGAAEPAERAGGPPRRRLRILDCRSRTAAAANFTTGGGFELVRHYDNADIQFLQLDNIHAVRGAFAKLGRMCASTHLVDDRCPQGSKHPAAQFWTKLDVTGWPELTMKLIWASWRAAELLVAGDSVLVHCTDGWDRTAQVVSLAMMQLDSYYRTVEGFCVLVMREWLEMGHRFADRCGHDRAGDDAIPMEHSCEGEDGGLGSSPLPATGPSGTSSPSAMWAGFNGVGYVTYLDAGLRPASQVAPVFVQFLDAVYQLLRMFPSDFEFTPRFLQYLMDHVYSCRFGTFLFNCHRSRGRENGVVTRTASIWGEVEELYRFEQKYPALVPAGEKLVNPFYIAPEVFLGDRRHQAESLWRPTSSHCGREGCGDHDAAGGMRSKYLVRRLSPSFQSYRYQFWKSQYCRYDFAPITGVIGLEPDHLTPFIDSWLHMVRRTSNCGSVHSSSEDGEGSAGMPRGRPRRDRLRTLFHTRTPLGHLTQEWRALSPPRTLIESVSGRILETTAALAARPAGLERAENCHFALPAADADQTGNADRELRVGAVPISIRIDPEAVADFRRSRGGTYGSPSTYLSSWLRGWPVRGTEKDMDAIADEGLRNTLEMHSADCGAATPDPTRGPAEPPTRLSTHWHASRCIEEESAGLESYQGVSLTVLGAQDRTFIARSDAKSCEICAEPFTFFFRRHTCRCCCRAVCATCGGRFLKVPQQLIQLEAERFATQPVRVCTVCYNKVLRIVRLS